MTDIQAQRNIKMFGCDPDEMIEDLKQSLTYQVDGKDAVLVSMLSDVQELMAIGQIEEARLAVNRVKFAVYKL